jgi:FlaA1/EpsC-like NDP-sugar epimerase
MGKPVRILDLAENMIRLSGYVPYVDIDIVEMGLRPGEKLYEELLIKTENLERTANDLIFVERDTPYTRARIDEMLDILRDAIRIEEDTLAYDTVKRTMMDLVPTFHDPDEVNSSAESCDEMKLAAH